MNRREFLGVGAGLLGGSFLPGLSQADLTKSGKSIIYIFLSGGISQIEFINPIPDAPVEFRSVTGNVKTRSGYLLGGNFTELAKISELLTPVVSFHHRDSNHQSASAWVNTSEFHVPNQGQVFPSYGSVVSHEFGSNSPTNGIPSYVKTRQIEGDDAAFLGVRYNGYDADSEGVANLKPRVPDDRFSRRLKIMSMIDDQDILTKRGLPNSWTELKDQSVEIIRGEAATAFDITKEKPELVSRYSADKAGLGRDLLLAKRLVERGTRFVTINTGGWDLHSNIENGFNTRAPQLDKYLSYLISDLKQDGMLDDTLIVVCSEFARTPRINGNSGRDHWSATNSLLFAGGGFEHGRRIGETDKNATSVISDEFSPKDFAKTIFDYFGINEKTFIDNQGRPRHLVDQSAKNILLS